VLLSRCVSTLWFVVGRYRGEYWDDKTDT
jgi:hypothetical protein